MQKNCAVCAARTYRVHAYTLGLAAVHGITLFNSCVFLACP